MLDRRAKAFSEVDAASLSEYRRITGIPEPRYLLLLDGFAPFKADWDSTTVRMPFYNVVMRILGEGRPLGVHLVATADRAGAVPTAVSANVTKRIVLRLSDESGYQVLGVPKDVLGDRSAPGRAIVEGLETQVSVLGGTANVAEQSKALAAVAERLRATGAPQAPEIGALPVSFPASRLPHTAGAEPVLGLADETLAPIGFEPVGTFAITGPPQSGKTNAMRAVVDAVRRFDPAVRLFHLAGRRAQLADHAAWMRSATSVDEVKSLAKELVDVVGDATVPGRLMIVVENVTQFADTEAERSLKELFQAVNRSDHFLIGDADVATLLERVRVRRRLQGRPARPRAAPGRVRRRLRVQDALPQGQALGVPRGPRHLRAERAHGHGAPAGRGRMTRHPLPWPAVVGWVPLPIEGTSGRSIA